MGAEDLIESIEGRQQENWKRRFYVTYKDIPQSRLGLWAYDFNFPQGITTIELDQEDLDYLFNKYKPLAEDDLKEKEEKRIKEERESITKEMESLERKMGKLKDRMKDVNNK